tara:strand:+ start:117 stop:308 length:192 start_codon:yes stop_codon:yes gene_type:complete
MQERIRNREQVDKEKTIKNQSKVIKEMWSELQTLKRILIDEYPAEWREIQYKIKPNEEKKRRF